MQWLLGVEATISSLSLSLFRLMTSGIFTLALRQPPFQFPRASTSSPEVICHMEEWPTERQSGILVSTVTWTLTIYRRTEWYPCVHGHMYSDHHTRASGLFNYSSKHGGYLPVHHRSNWQEVSSILGSPHAHNPEPGQGQPLASAAYVTTQKYSSPTTLKDRGVLTSPKL